MMSSALLLAVGAMLSGAMSDLLYRKAQMAGIKAGGFLALQSSLFAGTLWVYVLATDQLSRVHSATILYGVPGGIFAYLGLLLFLQSLRTGSAGVNVPVFRLSFVVTAAGGIVLLGEPATLPKLVGTVTAIVAVLSLMDRHALSQGKMGDISARLLLATVFFGLVGLLARKAAIEGSATIPLLAVQTIPFTVCAVSFAVATKQIDFGPATLRFAPIIAAFQLAWSIMLFESLQSGQASVSYPIVQLSFVVTAVLAVMFLGEPMTGQKMRGLALASLAVLAFAFS